MRMPSSSLHTRIRRGAFIGASWRSRPSLVVMSGTETTNSTPLATISRMMLRPVRVAVALGAVSACIGGFRQMLFYRVSRRSGCRFADKDPRQGAHYIGVRRGRNASVHPVAGDRELRVARGAIAGEV